MDNDMHQVEELLKTEKQALQEKREKHRLIAKIIGTFILLGFVVLSGFVFFSTTQTVPFDKYFPIFCAIIILSFLGGIASWVNIRAGLPISNHIISLVTSIIVISTVSFLW
jgi:hypothetical protein